MAKYAKTSDKLKQLIVQIRKKKVLGKGYGSLIAKQLNVSPSIVANVTSGINSNQNIIEAVIRLAENNLGISFEPSFKIVTEYNEEELKQKLHEIREHDLLPRNYSRVVSNQVGCTMARVRQVANLVFFNQEIAEAIVHLVENSKEKELIQRAKAILEQTTN